MSNVRLIGITNPIRSAMGTSFPQDLIAYCARVSNPANQENFDTAEKLLKYCIKHKHWSPFEMINVVMEIKTTRDIGRQILRHRSFSFQEFSQRYAEVDIRMFEDREARLQDKKNRQNSIETTDENIIDDWNGLVDQVKIQSISAYRDALDLGIAKEQARALLPEGLTPSVMYMNGTLRSWIHYCQLRMGEETQKEHREIAFQCWNILCEEFKFLKELDNDQNN